MSDNQIPGSDDAVTSDVPAPTNPPSLWATPSSDVVPAMPAPAPPPAFDLVIGDIGITRGMIITPNGNAPLKGSSWMAMDNTVTTQRIPTYAIVLAVVFALFCLLGLLFLLMKEYVTTGYVNVTVRSGDLQHTTQVPVYNVQQVAAVRAAVSQAQTMAASA